MSTTRKGKKRKAVAKPRKSTPFAAGDPPPRDERVPPKLWDLPLRVAKANDAGPRYNQRELAAKSGLSQSVLSKLASRANLYGLRLDTIYKLAAALNVSVSWLLGEAEARGPRPSRKRAPQRRGQTQRARGAGDSPPDPTDDG